MYSCFPISALISMKKESEGFFSNNLGKGKTYLGFIFIITAPNILDWEVNWIQNVNSILNHINDDW